MGNLSVIGGKAKGFNLQSVPGSGTRPIMAKVKAAVFNIVAPYNLGSTWLDLFAGTGSVGIEALSRGASWARFVENQGAAIKTIQANLEHTGLAVQSEVRHQNVFTMLHDPADRRFDFVYIAPPQFKGIWQEALLALDQNPGWLVDDSWILVQIDRVEYQPLDLDHLTLFDRRYYGSTELDFYMVKDGVLDS
jgi:16S rRNA (guanine(966)-N(2))-methyltransferase RsmD